MQALEQKLLAWLSSPSAWALIVVFVVAGLKAIQTHFTGSVADDIGTVVAVLGLIFHPVDITAGVAGKSAVK